MRQNRPIGLSLAVTASQPQIDGAFEVVKLVIENTDPDES